MATYTFAARTRTVASIVNEPAMTDDGEPKPSEEVNNFWIFERPRGPTGPTDGKWMLFFLDSDIDAAWMKAKRLFRAGKTYYFIL